jgi:hypothetical protein
MWLVHLCCVIASFLVNMLFLNIKSELFVIRLFFQHCPPLQPFRDRPAVGAPTAAGGRAHAGAERPVAAARLAGSRWRRAWGYSSPCEQPAAQSLGGRRALLTPSSCWPGSQGCRCSCSFPRSDAGDGPHEDMGHGQPRLAVPTRDPGDGDTPTSARPKLTIRAATLASIKSCDH